MLDNPDYREDGALLSAIASIGNQNTGFGTARDKNSAVEVNTSPRILNWGERLGLFRSNKVVEKLVLLPPQSAAKYFGSWAVGHSDGEEDHADTINKLDEYCSKLNLVEAFTEASIEGRLNGDGWIVVDCQDGRDISEPIDRENIKSIGFLEVLGRDLLLPNGTQSISNPVDYTFNINPDTSEEFRQLNPRTIHKDRVLRFPGKRLTTLGLRHNGGYNDSILQSCFSELSTYLQSYYSVGGMLADYSVFKYGLKGLAQLTQSGDTSALVNRFVAIQMGLSSLKGLFLDSDTETAEWCNRSFGGLDPILKRMDDFLVTASGFPRSKLLGHSGESAMSEGGKSDERLWADLVIEYQNTFWTHPRRRIGELICLAADGPTGGQIPDGFGFTWESAIQLTAKEQAELEKLYAETDKLRIESKSLHPIEARERLSGYKFNHQITLRDEFTDALNDVFDDDTDDMEDGTESKVPTPVNETEETEKPRADWESKFNLDDSTKAKKVITWQGYKIGLQYLPFDTRHGKTLTAGYGYFQNTKGADGMALDCYVGTNLESNKLFVIDQVIDGEFDEHKFIIGVDTLEHAESIYKSAMPPEFMGDIKECDLADLKSFNTDSEVREDKSIPKNPKLWAKAQKEAKAKFDVFPSLYANQWASKRYKELGGEWRSDSTEWVELRLDGSVSDAIEVEAMASDRKYIPADRAAKLTKTQLKKLAKLEYS